MHTYTIDYELGLVYELINGLYYFICTLLQFKQPENSNVTYFSTVPIGE